MLDKDVRHQLEAMGIDAAHYRLVVLLPLVEVAWADGKVQAAERALIQQLAERVGIAADGPGRALLERWLTEKPSAFYLSRGRKLLGQLAGHPEFEEIGLHSLEEVVGYCRDLASAAGGLFGVIGNKVDPAEEAAIAEIARVLHVGQASR